jgi:hypothetical protein
MGPRDVWAPEIDEELSLDLAYDGTTYSATTSTSGEWSCGLVVESSVLPGNWTSIYREMVYELNSMGHSGSFEISWVTPVGSAVTNSGIRLEDTSGNGIQWTITPQNDLTEKALGLTSTGTITSDASGVWTSEKSSGLVWQPHTIHSQSPAQKKDKDEKRYLQSAGDDVRYAPSIEYGDPLVTRSFEYRMIPAAHVEEDAARDATAAQVAGLPSGDTLNSYYRLWDRLSRRQRVIVQHGEEGAWSPFDTSTEWGRLHSSEDRKKLRSVMTRSDEDMRHYNIDLKLALEGSDNV